MIYHGSCHCGGVTFEVTADEEVDITECNCSICQMTGYQHLMVPKEDFTLLSGKELITTYTFNTGIAQHTFCSRCGIKSFYTPRSNPNGVSVNLRCLITKPRVTRSHTFNGQEWEAHIDELIHRKTR